MCSCVVNKQCSAFICKEGRVPSKTSSVSKSNYVFQTSNALQFYVSTPQDDTAALVENQDVEVGYERGILSSLPPQWYACC